MRQMRSMFGLLLALILIAVMFISMLFIAKEMGHHDCSGEDCPICSVVEECINNIRRCGTAANIISCTAVLLPFIVMADQGCVEEARKYNPISNKVRLNY